jgi:hypothetical protein
LLISRKGGKVVTIPLALRTAQAIDLPSASAWGIFFGPDGQWLDRHGAARSCAGWPAAPDHQADRAVHAAHAFITAALDAEVRSGTYRKTPRTPARARPCATTVPAALSTGTPPASSPPTLPEPPVSN